MFSFSLYLSRGSYDSAGDAKVANNTHRLPPPSFYLTGGGGKKVSMLSSIFPLQESLAYHNTFDWNQVLLWENESF